MTNSDKEGHEVTWVDDVEDSCRNSFQRSFEVVLCTMEDFYQESNAECSTYCKRCQTVSREITGLKDFCYRQKHTQQPCCRYINLLPDEVMVKFIHSNRIADNEEY